MPFTDSLVVVTGGEIDDPSCSTPDPVTEYKNPELYSVVRIDSVIIVEVSVRLVELPCVKFGITGTA